VLSFQPYNVPFQKDENNMARKKGTFLSLNKSTEIVEVGEWGGMQEHVVKTHTHTHLELVSFTTLGGRTLARSLGETREPPGYIQRPTVPYAQEPSTYVCTHVLHLGHRSSSTSQLRGSRSSSSVTQQVYPHVQADE
jgi:hypothetical protein